MHSKHAYRTQPTLEYRGLYSNNDIGRRPAGRSEVNVLVASCENRPAASVFARKGLDPRHEEDDIMTGQQMYELV
ncbi:hypothetical protein PCASD_19535 [Puccinia coronata f. sp. avenae]|uniref:Uncharacterized protein n=1 Tax=Puccinia coronata f. sp. avenae TaxID=200324 RepID=A0A2N5SMN7_9BASI|nr:hypothetical protein PCASD_19535 [Puccinia coronata f. sp. avenae]